MTERRNCGLTEPHEWHRGCDGVEPRFRLTRQGREKIARLDRVEVGIVDPQTGAAEVIGALDVVAELAEVWCSECDQPSAREIARRTYCELHAGMAERVILSLQPEREATVALIADYFRLIGALRREVSRDKVANAIFDMLFVPSEPSPETISRAAREGSPAL